MHETRYTNRRLYLFTFTLGHFDSGDLAMTSTAPDRVLGSVTPDVLPSRQHHCNVDKWRSLDVRCGADRPPTMENDPYAIEPP